MKKFVNIFLTVCLALSFTSCTVDDTPPPVLPETPVTTPIEETDIWDTDDSDLIEKPFKGKIAIITSPTLVFLHPTEYYSAIQQTINNYGEDKFIHITLPEIQDSDSDPLIYTVTIDKEQAESIIKNLGDDPEIKAIIINGIVPEVNDEFERLHEKRKDIFIATIANYTIVGAIYETDDFYKVHTSNLVLMDDDVGIGPAIVEQAHKMGAKTFVHYSFPKHMSNPIVFERCELIKQKCEELGVEFVYADDPFNRASESMQGGASQVFLDVSKYVDQYGKDTAFFHTSSFTQFETLINDVVREGAMIPHNRLPSLYRVASVLGIHNINNGEIYSFEDVISQINEVVREENMAGRLSSWPVPTPIISTIASAEYAIKWINGEVSKEGIDIEVLKQLMKDYAGVNVYLTPYTDEYPYTENGTGETYGNVLLMRMDYITFE